MVQQYQRRPERYAAPDADGPRVLPTISASPVDAVVESRMSPEVDGLLRGLSSLNSSLAAREAQDEREGEKRRADGRAFAAAGGSRADAEARKDKTFLEGFFEGDGAAAAIRDAEEASAGAQEELNKNGGDVGQFIGQFYQRKMAGQTNEAFRRGYDRVFGQEAMKIRAQYAERTAREILDRNTANAMSLIDYAVRSQYKKGQPLPATILDEVNTIAKDAGLSNQTKDELLFLSLKRFSEDGDPAVWEVARLPRKDTRTGQALPSLYSNPKWKEKIDVEERQAKDLALRRLDADREAARRERIDRQQAALGEVIALGLDGKVDEARALASKLWQERTLFSRGDELAAAVALFDKTVTSVERPEEQLAKGRHLIDIYSGKHTPESLLKLSDVGTKVRLELVREWRAHQSMLAKERSDASAAAAAGRAAAAAERTAFQAAFNSPTFRSTVGNVEAQLAPVRNRMQPSFGPVDAAHERQQVMAIQELTQWRALNPNASDLDVSVKAQEITQRFLQARRNDPQGDVLLRLQGIPYRNRADLLRDKDRLSPAVYMQYRAILIEAEAGQGTTK